MFDTLLTLGAGALVSGGLLSALVTLLVVGVVFWILWWLIGYINPPEPFKKVATVLLAIVAAVFVINLLLGLTGTHLF